MPRLTGTPTLATLKSQLTYLGVATSGIKSVLTARLERALRVPRLPSTSVMDDAKDLGHKRETRSEKMRARDEKRRLGDGDAIRILSVDMGIRNLAFCVVDVQMDWKRATPKVKSTRKTKESKTAPARAQREPDTSGDRQHATLQADMHVVAWRRIDVADEVNRTIGEIPPTPGADPASDDAAAQAAYHPSMLSRTAHALLTRTLLPYAPAVILLERQRFRSGGGAAVLEWTVRVNMLEAMLWAVLRTLQSSCSSQGAAPSDPPWAVEPVSPKAVGAFWVGGRRLADPDASADAPGPASERKSTAKAEKKAKIALVRSWLARKSARSEQEEGDMFELDTPASAPSASPARSSTARSPTHALPGTRLRATLSTAAEPTRTAFLRAASAAGSRRRPASKTTDSVRPSPADDVQAHVSAESPPESLKKLDDVADCLLQAAAWVAWEGNRRQMTRQWNPATELGRPKSVAGEEEKKMKKKDNKRAKKKDI